MPIITIDIPASQVSRIAAAYGALKSGPSGEPAVPATMIEVRAALVRHMKDVVTSYEEAVARQNITVAPVDIP